MEKNQKNKLVIISLPFYRITRALLSEVVVNALTVHADIIVVGPFVEEPQFKHDFSHPNVKFLKWEINPIPRWKKKIYWASEIMRRNGFWMRFKDKGMRDYLVNRNTNFCESGQDEMFRLRKRFLINIFTMLGKYPVAWKICRSIMGRNWCRFPELVAITRGYKKVTLIQAANWGEQDNFLAFLSQREGWRKILIPYTTDQLYCNGYLLNRFDAVCVQGAYEYNRAKNYFNIPDSKIFTLGSTWFRHVDLIKEQIEQLHYLRKNREKHIIYAGCSPIYFPRINEFLAIDVLLEMISSLPTGLKLIYRPVTVDEASKAEIIDRYGNIDEIEITWPDASVIGLENDLSEDRGAALRRYVLDLDSCELFIMSSNTSMVLDAVYISNCPVLSNLIDLGGVLRKRNSDFKKFDGLPGLKVARSVEEFRNMVLAMLEHKEQFSLEARKMAEVWDAPKDNFESTLLKAVF